MGEEGADVPLWGDDGPLFDDGAEMLREWAVSAELVEDIVAWARAWRSESGEPKHDAEAARLVRQLSRQLNYRFLILYHP